MRIMSQNQNDTNNATDSENLEMVTASNPVDKPVTTTHTNKLSKPCNSEGNIKTQGLRQKLVNKVKSWNTKEAKGFPSNTTANAVETGLVSDLQTLHLSNDSSVDNLCRTDWLRARDSLENLLTPRVNKSLGSDVSSSKSAHVSNSKQTKTLLSECPHSESLIGGNKSSAGCPGGSKMLTWDPWDKMGRKAKDSRNRKTEKAPTTRDNAKHSGQDFDTSGDEVRSNAEASNEAKQLEPEMYEYQPYRQPKNTKSVEFTNKVLVVYFNSDEVVCESTEPLKKEHDQQVRNKEMRMGHMPTTLMGKRRCLDDYMDAWFKK